MNDVIDYLIEFGYREEDAKTLVKEYPLNCLRKKPNKSILK